MIRDPVLRPHYETFLELYQKDIIEKVIDQFQHFKDAEKLAFGPNSYFNRKERGSQR